MDLDKMKSAAEYAIGQGDLVRMDINPKYIIKMIERIRFLESEFDRACLALWSTYPRSGIGGQMVTSYRCFRCNEEKTHADTSTPIICLGCLNEMRNNRQLSEVE